MRATVVLFLLQLHSSQYKFLFSSGFSVKEKKKGSGRAGAEEKEAS